MANTPSVGDFDFIDAVPTDGQPPLVVQPNDGNSVNDVTASLSSLSVGESDRYPMNHLPRGLFYIINNKKFSKETLGERTGTDVDAEKLEADFETIGFKVERLDNQTAEQMHELMIKVSEENHANYDCFGVAILTHGEKDGILYGTDGKILLENLVKPIQRCKSLVGKPKIFIIQACRGEELDKGIQKDDPGTNTKPQRLPVEADCLYAYSTVPGYYAWRNSVKGSWFVQALHSMIKEYVFHIDFVKMLTRVNYEVAYKFESSSSNEKISGSKQISTIESMLTKDLYFPKPSAN